MQTFSLREFAERSGVGNEAVDQFLAVSPNVSKDGPWLAGGACRRFALGSDELSDFDMFFKDQGQADAYMAGLLEKGFSEIYRNEFNVTFRLEEWKVQCIIINFFPTVEAVIDSFDFTICQFATDGVSLFCGDYALFDLCRKRLAVHKITYATSSVRRIIKYAGQGYKVCNGCIAAILNAVAADPSVVNANVEYID